MPTQHGHGEERSDEAIQPLTKLEAMSLSNGWIATASFAHLATTGFSDSFSPLARKLPLQPGHGAVEGCREFDALDVGEHEDAPQAAKSDEAGDFIFRVQDAFFGRRFVTDNFEYGGHRGHGETKRANPDFPGGEPSPWPLC